MASTEADTPMAGAFPVELSQLFAAPLGSTRDEAWADFVAAHSRLLLHIARSVTADRDAAMDGYAYVLERLREDDCRRLRAYVADGRGKFTTWLVVVARRLCLDFHRHRYGRAPATGVHSAVERASRRRLVDLVGEKTDPDQVPAPGHDPATSLQALDLRERLTDATSQLPPVDLLLLTLRFEDDLSAREIAAVLGLPSPFHVYRRLNTILKLLRDRLRRQGVDEADP